MKLIIDIGNTTSKIALFQEKELVTHLVIDDCSYNKVIDFVGNNLISGTIISSVKAKSADVIKLIDHFNALFLDEMTPLPIIINYKTPKTLGRDRIAAVVGAASLFKNKDVLVIDAGTCITFDFINKLNEYEGGRISPGITMRYKALHHFTNKLPLCDISEKSIFIGDDTESSIISGVQQGIISEVNAIIKKYKEENKDTIIAVTGGDCFFFEKELKSSIFANPFLVMKGLNEILDYNE